MGNLVCKECVLARASSSLSPQTVPFVDGVSCGYIAPQTHDLGLGNICTVLVVG